MAKHVLEGLRMAILKRRDQVVVFRVTSEEHAQLQKACETSGSRNLSDFVRLALLNRVQKGMATRSNLAGLEKRLAELEATYSQTVKCSPDVKEQSGKASDELG